MAQGTCVTCGRTEAQIIEAHGTAGDGFSRQMHLGAMLSEAADRIATNRMGDVEECVLFIRGKTGAAIITLPQEPAEATIQRLETALNWMRTGELLP